LLESLVEKTAAMRKTRYTEEHIRARTVEYETRLGVVDPAYEHLMCTHQFRAAGTDHRPKLFDRESWALRDLREGDALRRTPPNVVEVDKAGRLDARLIVGLQAPQSKDALVAERTRSYRERLLGLERLPRTTITPMRIARSPLAGGTDVIEISFSSECGAASLGAESSTTSTPARLSLPATY
jgi:hypothetical protein